ncbi:hypothetical protein TNCV_4174361 [Trichonephila clavipes]|nr:hypothetical protein TNCV_4174361 [Trichonephila clavipes]
MNYQNQTRRTSLVVEVALDQVINTQSCQNQPKQSKFDDSKTDGRVGFQLQEFSRQLHMPSGAVALTTPFCHILSTNH